MDLEFDQDSTTFKKSCELVDTTIEEAANSKKSLASTMVSVTSLMKQVEYSEKAAAQAKEDAAMSGLHIFAKVDELKKKQQLAKEKNDKHAREVTARKAGLATEVKGLQSRVSDVLNEVSVALASLNQMRRDLEKRLTSALEDKKLADKEKVERELSARKTLAYEESQMEKLAKESERLKQEEVNNSKLQQFLVDRGHDIFILDEDISRKFMDVSLSTNDILNEPAKSLTNDILNEPAKSHVDHIVLETSLGFGLDDDHVQGTTKEPMRREERVTLKPPIFFARLELLSKTPNSDLKKQKVNKNLAVGADLNSSPSVSDIFTQVGHAQSTEGSVAFGQTYDQEVASQSTKSYSTRFQEISTGRSKKGIGRKKGKGSKIGKVTSRSSTPMTTTIVPPKIIFGADDDLDPVDDISPVNYSDYDDYGYDGYDM